MLQRSFGTNTFGIRAFVTSTFVLGGIDFKGVRICIKKGTVGKVWNANVANVWATKVIPTGGEARGRYNIYFLVLRLSRRASNGCHASAT